MRRFQGFLGNSRDERDKSTRRPGNQEAVTWCFSFSRCAGLPIHDKRVDLYEEPVAPPSQRAMHMMEGCEDKKLRRDQSGEDRPVANCHVEIDTGLPRLAGCLANNWDTSRFTHVCCLKLVW